MCMNLCRKASQPWVYVCSNGYPDQKNHRNILQDVPSRSHLVNFPAINIFRSSHLYKMLHKMCNDCCRKFLLLLYSLFFIMLTTHEFFFFWFDWLSENICKSFLFFITTNIQNETIFNKNLKHLSLQNMILYI